MKKFIIVMISLLVLFVFLMLNYLLWDKENLLKQRDTDKIEQSWLRGQNLSLQSTIDELESTNDSLEIQIKTQKDRILELEKQVSEALKKENENLIKQQVYDESVKNYKISMKDAVNDIVINYFSDITARKFEDSWQYMDANCKLWDKTYNLDDYVKMISVIRSIMVREKISDDEPVTVLFNQGEPNEIKTRILVRAFMEETKKENFSYLENGDNTLEVVFTFSTDLSQWVISSISSLKDGKP